MKLLLLQKCVHEHAILQAQNKKEKEKKIWEHHSDADHQRNTTKVPA